jgi:hypothetical protein
MRVIKISSVFALALIVSFAGSARADEVMKVKVPFEFVVGNRSFPAGLYEVGTVSLGSGVFAIQGADNALASVAMTIPADGRDPVGSRPALVFHRYENTYRLSQIWESSTEGRALTGPPARKAAGAEARLAPSGPETYVIAGSLK